MPDVKACAPLEGFATTGRFGANVGAAGITIEEQSGLALASVIVRRGAETALSAAVATNYGVTLPHGARAATKDNVTWMGVAPGQWLACAGGPAGPGFVMQLEARLSGLAAVSDQSDARVVLHIGGPRVRDLLAKGVALDLHPRAFAAGDVASTLLAHMGVQVRLLDDASTFQIMTLRSQAASLWAWLAASAAEFGYEVKRP